MNPKRKLSYRKKYLNNSLNVLRSNYQETLDNLKKAMREERYEIIPDIESTLTSIRKDIRLVTDRLDVINQSLERT